MNNDWDAWRLPDVIHAPAALSLCAKFTSQ